MPVSITFRTNGAWGAGIGANLTPTQVDTNFYNLKTAVEQLEADMPDASPSISNITFDGSQITFHLSNGSTYGPFTVPTATTYIANEVDEISDATYELALTEQNKYLRCTHASGCTVTVPPHADVPIPIKTEFHFRQCTSGGIDFVEGETSVVINGIDGYLNISGAEGAVVTLKKVAADEWDLFGLLEPNPASA